MKTGTHTQVPVPMTTTLQHVSSDLAYKEKKCLVRSGKVIEKQAENT